MSLVDTFQNVYAPYVRARIQSEAGASLVEYALLTALIAMVCVGAVSFIGTSLDGSYEEIGSGLEG